MSEFIVIDPINDERWGQFISKCSQANMFHMPGWMKTLKDQYGFSVFACCLIIGGEITAGIPFCETKTITGKKKWISLPFSDFVPPLYFKENDLEELLREIISYYKKEGNINKIEIRYQFPVRSEFISVESDVLYIRDLSMPNEEIFSSFGKNPVQRPIKKALKSGLSYEINNSAEAVEEFYRIHLITRKKLGVPIQPKKFFIHFQENIIMKENGFIILVKHPSGKVISAGILAGFNGNVSIKYSASDRDYLEFRPNNLMFWASIEASNNKGYKTYDFGKTAIKQESLCQFKSYWGTRREKLGYNFYPEGEEQKEDSFILNKIIGPMIKFGPKFVCRAIGELLYKYSV